MQDDKLRYEIVPDEAGNKALEFFWMNEADGEIVVKKLLSESADSSFTVSLVLCSSVLVALLVLTASEPIYSSVLVAPDSK